MAWIRAMAQAVASQTFNNTGSANIGTPYSYSKSGLYAGTCQVEIIGTWTQSLAMNNYATVTLKKNGTTVTATSVTPYDSNKKCKWVYNFSCNNNDSITVTMTVSGTSETINVSLTGTNN